MRDTSDVLVIGTSSVERAEVPRTGALCRVHENVAKLSFNATAFPDLDKRRRNIHPVLLLTPLQCFLNYS